LAMGRLYYLVALAALAAGVLIAVLLPDAYHSVLAPAYLHVKSFTGKPGGGFVVDHRLGLRILALIIATILGVTFVVLGHRRRQPRVSQKSW
ncbi:MAG TPA: hypothetical protein DIT48_03730, partial [Actinobacteria bacterium]|nr:hypothetical protein [Actinomycetota bacterium]HCP60885.1 hypothetical protein [Actinomycetota bacterium]